MALSAGAHNSTSLAGPNTVNALGYDAEHDAGSHASSTWTRRADTIESGRSET